MRPQLAYLLLLLSFFFACTASRKAKTQPSKASMTDVWEYTVRGNVAVDSTRYHSMRMVYDADGNMIEERYYLKSGATDWLRTRRFTYSMAGLPMTELRYSIDSTVRSKTIFDYSHDGWLVQRQLMTPTLVPARGKKGWEDGFRITYHYDKNRRIYESVSHPPDRKDSVVMQYQYTFDKKGHLRYRAYYDPMLARPATVHEHYDSLGRLTDKTQRNDLYDCSYDTLHYEYDPGGRLISEWENYCFGAIRTTKYTYDAEGRILEAIISNVNARSSIQRKYIYTKL